ncbi:FeoC-like transcriptional regulator [Pontiella agarivorans]|uniref:FeoC-like transcriptional regulator n=1 Tax=Pontiella agarivorans TaxID=3038953 RepID=A0ABU5MWA1_9BACT|nr:FeoC-like transcriptional regulator [Pontiella agarivorans]MDZ8118506.1 FeoC-like transcriptional regulator [Pontiella agarivorans]
MLDQIMDVLTPRRMMSVGNLASSLEMEAAALQPRLDQLEAGGRIRYALSKCAGSCSTCSGCGDSDEPAEPVVDETAIVISLELRQEED